MKIENFFFPRELNLKISPWNDQRYKKAGKMLENL